MHLFFILDIPQHPLSLIITLKNNGQIMGFLFPFPLVKIETLTSQDNVFYSKGECSYGNFVLEMRYNWVVCLIFGRVESTIFNRYVIKRPSMFIQCSNKGNVDQYLGISTTVFQIPDVITDRALHFII
jgi:hypothetical protein